jgi:putative oxidoreductase
VCNSVCSLLGIYKLGVGILSILSIIFQVLLAFIFLMTGFMSISGNKQQIEQFEHLNLPQWFRIVTGLVQLIGVVGLVIGFWYPSIAALAGLWAAITMLGGFATHLKAKDPISKAMPALILTILAIIITVINLSALLSIFK